MADACVHILLNVSFKDIIKDHKGDIRNTHINIGTGKELTIAQLAELVTDAVGFSGTIEWDSSKPDGTMQQALFGRQAPQSRLASHSRTARRC